MVSASIFQDGGKLRENAFYIERAADELLYESLCKGEYCSILDPRQVGKSSLMERTARRLTESGVRCGYVDMQSFANAEITFEKLVFSLIFTISRSLDLQNDNLEFLEKYASTLSPNKMLEQFFREVVFTQIDSNIVLFIDEVDIVKFFKNSPGTPAAGTQTAANSSEPSNVGDSFFLTFRSFHEDRVNAPFNRLTICFAGVAFPADLVSRSDISPFNVGRRILLSDFTLEEMQGFRAGLTTIAGDPDELIGEVYKWTSGHPYMTQKVFADLTKGEFDGRPVPEIVEERVNVLFLQPNVSPDANLAYAVKRLTSPFDSEAAKNRRPQILETFFRIKQAKDKRVPLVKNLSDNESPSYDESRLFGLTSIVYTTDGNYLKIRNLIYDKFFSDVWVEKLIGEQRDFRPFFEQWLKKHKADDYLLRGDALASTLLWAVEREDITKEEREFIDRSQEMERQQQLTGEQAKRFKTFRIAAMLLAVLLAFAGYLAYEASIQSTRAQLKSVEAQEQANIAKEQYWEAQKQKEIALQESEKATKQKEIADEKSIEAQKQKEIAQQEKIKADLATANAVVSANIAKRAQANAEQSAAEADSAKQATIEAKRQGELLSDITLRQERAIQTQRYTPQQQAVFRGDAANLANSNSNLQTSPLPKTFKNWNGDPLVSDPTTDSDQVTSYVGELVTPGKVRKNYYLESSQNFIDWQNPNPYTNDVTNVPDQELIFRGPNQEQKIIPLPPFLHGGKFARDGNFWMLRDNESIVVYDGVRARSFGFPKDTSLTEKSLLESVHISENDPNKIALIVDSQPNSFYVSDKYLLVLNIKTQAIEKFGPGYYFVNISDDIFLFEDNTGLNKIDIKNGKLTPMPGLASLRSASDQSTLMSMRPFYDKKTQTLVVSMLRDGGGLMDYKAYLSVYNISDPKPTLEKPFITEGEVKALSAGGDYALTSSFGTTSILKLRKIMGDTTGSVSISPASEVRLGRFFLANTFSPDGSQLAVADDNTCHIIDTKAVFEAGATEISKTPLLYHDAQIRQIAFYTAGNADFIVTGDATGILKISRLEGPTASLVKKIDLSSAIEGIDVIGNDLAITTKTLFSRISYTNNNFIEKRSGVNNYLMTLRKFKVSPTFDTIATYEGREGQIWNSEDKQFNKSVTLDGEITFVEYASSGRQVIFGNDHEAVLLSTKEREKNSAINLFEPLNEKDEAALAIKSVGFSGSGDLILVKFKSGYAIYDSKGKEVVAPRIFVPDSNAPKSLPEPHNFSSDPDFNFFPSESQFSPDESLVVVSTKAADDGSISNIIKNVPEFFKESENTQKSLVKIIRVNGPAKGEVLKQFIIDNFDHAKFSPLGNVVALFTKGSTKGSPAQCYIADPNKDEALLIPLENARYANFSKDGKQIVFLVDKTIYIYNTATANLTHKTAVRPNEGVADIGKKWIPVGQTINFVRFDNNNDLEIGREVSYSENKPAGTQVSSSPSNANANSNSKYVVTMTGASNSSSKPASETLSDFGCYRINSNGMLVAKSGCGP